MLACCSWVSFWHPADTDLWRETSLFKEEVDDYLFYLQDKLVLKIVPNNYALLHLRTLSKKIDSICPRFFFFFFFCLFVCLFFVCFVFVFCLLLLFWRRPLFARLGRIFESEYLYSVKNILAYYIYIVLNISWHIKNKMMG